MKRIIKDVLILFAITLVAGLGLGAVYNLTLDARKTQEEKTLEQAFLERIGGDTNEKSN